MSSHVMGHRNSFGIPDVLSSDFGLIHCAPMSIHERWNTTAGGVAVGGRRGFNVLTVLELLHLMVLVVMGKVHVFVAGDIDQDRNACAEQIGYGPRFINQSEE